VRATQRSLAMRVAAMKGDRAAVFLLASRGEGSVVETDGIGRTLLHHVAAAGSVDMMRDLLALGADDAIDARDGASDTALTLAITAPANCIDCVRLLIETGADTTIAGRGGVLPVSLGGNPGAARQPPGQTRHDSRPRVS